MVFLLIFLGKFEFTAGQSHHYQYDRLHIELADIEVDSTLELSERDYLDSIFHTITQDLLEFERLLGYKLTGQLHLRLFTNRADYQQTLQSHQLWKERLTNDFTGVSSNYYPIFIATPWDKIRIQLRYAIAHSTLNEFLNGSSVRQKMTQSGYQHFPSWIFQGLCAYWSSSWTITAQDEFSYFCDKGAFRHPNDITPLACQVFGRYVWKDWIQTYGLSAISNFWFVLKYTGQAETAVTYLTGQSFSHWFHEAKDELIQQNQEPDLPRSTLLDHLEASPVLNLIELCPSPVYLIQSYVPDEEVWMIDRDENIKTGTPFQYRKAHAKLLSETDFYLLEFDKSIQSQNSTFRLSIIQPDASKSEIRIDSNGCVVVDSLIPWSVKASKGTLEFINEKGTWVKPKGPNSNTQNPSYSIARSKLGKDSSIIQLLRMDGNTLEYIWSDTISCNDVAKDLLVESNNLISHIQSVNNQYYINFTQINEHSLLRWKISLDGNFCRQFLSHQQPSQDAILELSFKDNRNQLRILEGGELTASEIKEMLRKSTIPTDSVSEALLLNKGINSAGSAPKDSWTFVSPYEVKDVSKLRQNGLFPHYESGTFKSSRAVSTMQLDRGGLFLSNEESTNFPMLADVNPNKFYNHPLTPELRFYLSNPRFNHHIKAGMLANLPLSRIAIRLEQEWKLNRWIIHQKYHHRNRDYNTRDGYIKKTLGDKFSVGLTRIYLNKLSLSVDLNFQRDESFPRINSPISGRLWHETIHSRNLTLQAHYEFNGSNSNRHRRYHGEILGKTGITDYAQWIKVGSQYLRSSGNLGLGCDFQLAAQLQKNMGGLLHFEGKLQLNSSVGEVKNQYWVGGSQGWINPTPWDISIANSWAVDDDGYRMIGGYVRGFYSGVRLGHSSAVLNLNIGITPFKLIYNDLIKSEILKRLELYTFLDAGTAYVGWSPSDEENPFNRVTISTPNLQIDVYAKRNPWVLGTGFGVSTQVLRMPIRYEVAWGLKEGKILTPIQHVCMTWNF